MTRNIFVAYGGSGSSWIVRRMGGFMRPDSWQVKIKGGPLPKHFPGQIILDEKGYENIIDNYDDFNQRTGNLFAKKINTKKTIKHNMSNFFNWINQNNYKVLSSHSGIVKFFSENNIENVSYLVRHPLHSLVSWAKPERHFQEVISLRGLNNKNTIEFWADAWNSIAEDYLVSQEKGLDPLLIRYEYAHQDTKHHSELNKYFENFDSSKRNHGIMLEPAEDYLKQLTGNNYFKLYGKWEI